MPASTQANRIITMVAELTRREREGGAEVTLSELAGRHGVSIDQVAADIRALTLLGEDPDAEWVLSLSVLQEGDTLVVRSRGPWQRPMRFTPDELIAIQLGLADEGGADGLSRQLAGVLGAATTDPRFALTPGAGSCLGVLRDAIASSSRIEILYAGEGAFAGRRRVIQPHELVGSQGYWYAVAWCELASGWRYFRTDRILDALPTDGRFAPRDDFASLPPGADVFREPDGGAEPVRVRFSPAIARWIRERYPAAELQRDGSVVVTWKVASPQWLVRHVLQYGPDAEVVEPAGYRAMMREAVTG